MSNTISVIIAIINEERTIGSIVEGVQTWGKAKEIIVVNDEATTDKTVGVLRRVNGAATLLTNKKGRGKGDAVAVGIEGATGDIIVVLDGDITNLMHKDLDNIIKPLIDGTADLVIAVPRFWTKAGYEPFNDVSGTRAFWKEAITPHLRALHKAGYGMEILINGLFTDSRIKRIKLPHVFVFNKFEKQTLPDAVQAYIREAKELVMQSVKQQAGDLPPSARTALRSVQKYLKFALDYIQQ